MISQDLPAVGRPEDHLRAVIDDVGIVGRRGDRRRPLKPILHVFAAVARRVLRPRAHVARLSGAVVVARDDAEILARIHDVGVRGVRHDVSCLAAADVVPVRQRDAVPQAVARSLRRAQVLHRAGDVIRRAGVRRHVVELAQRQLRREPRLAAVGGDVDAAIVGDDQPPGVLRIDPGIVIVAVVKPFDVLERLPAIDAVQHRHLREPDLLPVGGIDRHRRVVPRTLPQRA